MTEEVKDAAEGQPQEQPQSSGSTAQDVAGQFADVIKQTVSGRGNIYGTPEENFGNIANFWQCYLIGKYGIEKIKAAGIQFLPQDVGYMCALMKLARLIKTPMHPDTILDAAVYSLLGGGCAIDLDQKMAATVKQMFEQMAKQAPAEEEQKPQDFDTHGQA